MTIPPLSSFTDELAKIAIGPSDPAERFDYFSRLSNAAGKDADGLVDEARAQRRLWSEASHLPYSERRVHVRENDRIKKQVARRDRQVARFGDAASQARKSIVPAPRPHPEAVLKSLGHEAVALDLKMPHFDSAPPPPPPSTRRVGTLGKGLLGAAALTGLGYGAHRLLRDDKAKAAGIDPQTVQLPGTMPSLTPAPHGLQGRLRRPAVAGAREKQTQGPRAYAPRISNPMA